LRHVAPHDAQLATDGIRGIRADQQEPGALLGERRERLREGERAGGRSVTRRDPFSRERPDRGDRIEAHHHVAFARVQHREVGAERRHDAAVAPPVADMHHHRGRALGEIGQHPGEGAFLLGLAAQPVAVGALVCRVVDEQSPDPLAQTAGKVWVARRRVASRVVHGPTGIGLVVAPSLHRRHTTWQAEADGHRAQVPHSCLGGPGAVSNPGGPAGRSRYADRLMPATTVKISVPGNHLMVGLLGPRDEFLRLVETAFPTTAVHVRGNEISIDGPHADVAGRLFEELVLIIQQGQRLEPAMVVRTIDMVKADERPSEVLASELLRSKRGRSVRPKTANQKRYVDAIRDNVITFGVGPAGTGKSWLAVAMAVQALQAKQVERIILTRPAVEAGERLGFLPGDLMAKVDPYLRPLYDALHDMVETEGAARLLERGTVEVAPLAFMRGRTLNSSFIILDEAQNTTPEQMKMFLTRIGFGSRVVVTGDTTQVDVAGGRSGLDHLEAMLGHIDDIEFVHLTSRDVVRHRIVQDIVNAYENAAASSGASGARAATGAATSTATSPGGGAAPS